MSDRVLVMNEGQAEQLSNPFDIYNTPSGEFVADFIGEANLFDATVEGVGDDLVELGLDTVGDATAMVRPDRVFVDGVATGDALVLNVRPEDLDVAFADEADPSDGDDDQNRLDGTVQAKTFLGSATHVLVQVGGQEVLVETSGRRGQKLYEAGDDVVVSWDAADCILLERDA